MARLEAEPSLLQKAYPTRTVTRINGRRIAESAKQHILGMRVPIDFGALEREIDVGRIEAPSAQFMPQPDRPLAAGDPASDERLREPTVRQQTFRLEPFQSRLDDVGRQRSGDRAGLCDGVRADIRTEVRTGTVAELLMGCPRPLSATRIVTLSGLFRGIFSSLFPGVFSGLLVRPFVVFPTDPSAFGPCALAGEALLELLGEFGPRMLPPCKQVHRGIPNVRFSWLCVHSA